MVMAYEVVTTGDMSSRASPEQWRLATQAIAASCAVTSARAWMGYIPQGLVEDAQDALQQLASDEISAGMSLSSSGALRNILAAIWQV